MNLKTIILAGVTALSLAAPAAAFAEPEWGHDRGWHDRDGWRDRGEWRRDEWREREGWGYAPRCYITNRGYYNWYGEYVSHAVRVCR